jgi:hypothetical protein
MNLRECYRMLEVSEKATDEELALSFKRLAHKYHPDKNRDRIEWATRAMADLNVAYNMIMSHRFEDSADSIIPEYREEKRARKPKARKTEERDEELENFKREFLINKFVQFKENSKDALYRYFQYSLYNFARREEIRNRRVFNGIVLTLRTSYHSIKTLKPLTSDKELIEHFTTFNEMIFSFYKASECLNILDSYKNIIDVEAYRSFKKGDDKLHIAHKELFYDRHNRGFFKREIMFPNLMEAEDHFAFTVRRFPQSTWAVETGIKLEYVRALKKYFVLFFTE